MVDKNPVPEIDFTLLWKMALRSARKKGLAKVCIKDCQAVVPTKASIEVQAPAMQPPSSNSGPERSF